jgi:hypothetical protein
MRPFQLSRSLRRPVRSVPATRAGRRRLEALEDRLAPATLTVNSTADTASPSDPYLSLREAIAIVNSPTLPSGLSDQILGQINGTLHAAGADRIVFDPGQVSDPIVLGGTQLELSLPRGTATVTIDAGSGVTLDGAHRSRVFQVDSGVQFTLDHLTVTHGYAGGPGTDRTSGGAISNRGTLVVSHSVLSGNSAYSDGGGIYNFGGTLTVGSSVLSANSAQEGGAIANISGGRFTLDDSTLTSNSGSVDGGGVLNGGTMTVTRSAFGSNTTPFDGGGIENDGTLTVSSSALTGNTADTGGGIANLYTARLTVNSSGFIANTAHSLGGGIWNFAHSGATVTVDGCTFASNSGGREGGAIDNYLNDGVVTVTNSTMTSNSATAGGALFDNSGAPALRLGSTIVAGNRGTDITGRVDASGSYNLVGSSSGLSGISNGVNHNQIGTASSPIDPRLTPLGWYGGPSQTFALLPGSPARDTGNSGTTLTTDQRGLPRVVAGQTDIGAFQTQADPFLVTTLADPGREFGLLSLREAVALANVLPGDHAVSFDPTRDGGAITLNAGQLELSGTAGVTTIDGAGRFTLDGVGATRLVEVDPGTRAVLRRLALVNGNNPIGAGVYNQGTLTLADSVLYGNIGYIGGAVLNQGELTVSGCTLAFNIATFGAGIDNQGALTAVNSTFVYNAALQAGGAIRNDPTGTAMLTSLTISWNSADTGGGIDVAGGLVQLRNCIVAGNYSADGGAASDISGTVGSASTYNLIGTGGSGGLSDGAGHNRVGVADPGLTAPEFFGPETPVFGLASDSPAAGAGDPTLLADPVLRLDQHGNVRTTVNIGAV